MSASDNPHDRPHEPPASTEEWLDLVDGADRVIGLSTRAECHGDPTRRHRAVHVHVIGSDGRLLLQRRAWTKTIQPGRWDTAVGGHVAAGETREAAARREMAEEIGLKDVPLEHLYDYEWRTPVETEQVRTYLARSDGPFRPHPDEIIALEWFALERIDGATDPIDGTPNLREELRRLHQACPVLFQSRSR